MLPIRSLIEGQVESLYKCDACGKWSLTGNKLDPAALSYFCAECSVKLDANRFEECWYISDRALRFAITDQGTQYLLKQLPLVERIFEG